jgi:hypothetical protein
MPRIDRRAHQRFLAKPEDRVLYDERSVPVRDVSLGGIFILDPDPLPVGSEVAFTLRIGRLNLDLDGIVRHSTDQIGMGIQFTNVSALPMRRLTIHIASLLSAPSEMETA